MHYDSRVTKFEFLPTGYWEPWTLQLCDGNYFSNNCINTDDYISIA